MSEPKEPSAVSWNWRARVAGQQEAAAREAAANRRKGGIGGVIGVAAAAAVYYLLDRPVAAAVIAGIALLIVLIAMISPLGLYKTLSRGLDRFAYAVGSVVTWVLMTILYYVVFLPIGAFMRMRRKLAISRGADPRLPTYWISTEGRARTPESYRKQF
jgi:VIT1/CCC1 family predicted Fe2+/Mn2+ transporter